MSLKKASRTKSLSLSEDFPFRTPKPKSMLTTNAPTKRVEDAAKILKYIDENIIGKGVAFLGPFGRRKVVYADYASAGRSLQFFEDYIHKEVLPAFGNSDCISSVTGLQSQLYSCDAKDIVRSAVNATEDDIVFFCESAATSILERLSFLLCYKDERHLRSENGSASTAAPVLFVSTNEPTQNLAPWLNMGVEIVKITKTRQGFLDLVDLEKKLSKYVESKRLLIGLFSGSSRMTGILADDVATTILLHQYNVVSIWDYNSAGPFATINMNPVLPGAAKDIVFFSTNKFIGGVQGPGVIVIKKHLISQQDTPEFHNTIGVVGSVRAGLVVQLKESLGTQFIASRQEKLCKQIFSHVRTIPEIVLLGPTQTTAKRIPIISFLVKHPRGVYLHHRFVVAVLNDVFGIQSTAENHIGEALGINRKLTVEYDRVISGETQYFKSLHPGYTKILIPIFVSDAEVGFVLEALKMVATEAWKLLPQYEVDEKTGEWRHHSNSLAKEKKLLGSIRYTDGRMIFSDRRISGPGTFPQNYADCLQTARNIFNRARKMSQKSVISCLHSKLKDTAAENLRWFMLPGEAHELLLSHSQNVKNIVPFDPNKINAQEIPSLFTMFRHSSLSALDVKRYKSRSLPTSPVQIPVKRQHSSPVRPESLKESGFTQCLSPTGERFSLGRDSSTVAISSTPRIATIINNEDAVSSRNRCHSWSSTGATKSLSTQTRIELGLKGDCYQIARQNKIKPRLCSCSSQTELFSPDALETSSSTPSLQNSIRAGSNCSDYTEEIQAYVAEVTKELATEIKTEIREVISKVEDVLENTDTIDMSSINMSSLTNFNSNDSRCDFIFSGNSFKCLKEFPKRTEMENGEGGKSTSLENFNLLKKSSPPELMKAAKIERIESKLRKHHSESIYRPMESIERAKSRSESYPRPNSTSGWHHPNTAPSPESSTPNCPYTGAISKFKDTVCTASQDSGINMCFHDHEEMRARTMSENLTESRVPRVSARSQSDSVQCFRTIQETVLSTANCDCDKISTHLNDTTASPKLTKTVRRQASEIQSDVEPEFHRWHHVPKDVWKNTAEAIDEFDMLRDGDRILVCLSGSSPSLCMLHALRQFSRARGIHIEMAATTIGKCGIDPRALMLYLRDLNVDLFMEQLGAAESFRSKACLVATKYQFNVVAMGNTLDKLADEFLMSVLHRGRIYIPQAHAHNSDGAIRIIRPFIYVRERILEDFAVQKHLPTRPSRSWNKPVDTSHSILKLQELANPSVYENIKSALRPLLSVRKEIKPSSNEFSKTIK